MERVQHMTKSAIRRASQIEVNPQAKRNLQELFVNFTLILICLLLIYIIVLLSSWGMPPPTPRSRSQEELQPAAAVPTGLTRQGHVIRCSTPPAYTWPDPADVSWSSWSFKYTNKSLMDSISHEPRCSLLPSWCDSEILPDRFRNVNN